MPASINTHRPLTTDEPTCTRCNWAGHDAAHCGYPAINEEN